MQNTKPNRAQRRAAQSKRPANYRKNRQRFLEEVIVRKNWMQQQSRSKSGPVQLNAANAKPKQPSNAKEINKVKEIARNFERRRTLKRGIIELPYKPPQPAQLEGVSFKDSMKQLKSQISQKLFSR